MLLLSGTLCLLGCSITPNFVLSTNHPNDLVLVPYVSPTMNHDPWENYNKAKIEKLLDEIFTDELER